MDTATPTPTASNPAPANGSIPDEETLQNFISGRNQEWLQRQVTKLAAYAMAAITAWLVKKGMDESGANLLAGIALASLSTLFLGGLEMIQSRQSHNNTVQVAASLAMAAKKIALALLLLTPLALSSCANITPTTNAVMEAVKQQQSPQGMMATQAQQKTFWE